MRESQVSGAIDLDDYGETQDGILELSKINEAISLAADEDDHVLVSPNADVVPTQGEILTLGTVTFQTLV
jgi:uncharacterized phage protein gp47/JayE